MEKINVLGIVGSLRGGSYNRAILKAAIELAPPQMMIQTFDRLGEVPLYNEDVEKQGDPEPVQAFKNAIRGADAILIATPEYNFGVPGVLKNAIDWASRPPGRSVLNGKPAAIMGASPGTLGTSRSQLALRQTFLFTQTYALLQPEVLIGRAHEKIDAQGNLTDAKSREFIRQLLVSLVDWTNQLRKSKTNQKEAA